MLEKSKALFESAKQVLVGGVNSPVRSFRSVGGAPIFMKSAEKAYLKSVDGDRYIDYVLSWGPFLLGHSHPKVCAALEEGIKHGTSFGTPTPLEEKLARAIQEFYPSCQKLRFINSGTEAAMTAVRLARGFTKRSKIIKFSGCYHGHLDSLLVSAGSGAMTFGQPDSAGVLASFTAETLVCDYNDITAVKEAFRLYPQDIAAIIIEPVAGNMGLILPEPAFLQELRAITQTNGALLIFDEVMCGFRVWPKGGAQHRYEITPDLTILGKVIGGGLPCGAVGGRADIMDHLAPLGPVYQAGTLSGNPLVMRAGLATLDCLLHEDHYQRAEKSCEQLVAGFKQVLHKKGRNFTIHQIGTMFTVFFTAQKITKLNDVKTCDIELFNRYFHGMLKRGIYLAPSQYESNFLSSAHSAADIQQTIDCFAAVMDEIL